MIDPGNQKTVLRHVEIKAYVDDAALLKKRVAALATAGPINRIQHDTFFHCGIGRLKLRTSGTSNALIYYRRENDYGPTECFYQHSEARNPAALQASLSSAFGVAGRVDKFRSIYRLGRPHINTQVNAEANTEINIDKVGGLGDFVEIKVKIKPNESIDAATGQVESLMETLGIDLFQLVDGAYVDLINERAAGGSYV